MCYIASNSSSNNFALWSLNCESHDALRIFSWTINMLKLQYRSYYKTSRPYFTKLNILHSSHHTSQASVNRDETGDFSSTPDQYRIMVVFSSYVNGQRETQNLLTEALSTITRWPPEINVELPKLESLSRLQLPIQFYTDEILSLFCLRNCRSRHQAAAKLERHLETCQSVSYF